VDSWTTRARFCRLLGVDPDRILQKSFGETRRSTESRPREARPAETVVFIHSQKVSQASAGSTLLDLVEKNGVQIPYGCRQGLCGTCATRVLSGTVEMDVEAGLTSEQKNVGYVLPCVSGHPERLSWRLNPILPLANSHKRLIAEYGIKATGASYQLVTVKIQHTFNSAPLRWNCET
jgi:ferredoxin